MFCPNCGTTNSFEQNYCRGCGLRLDGIVEAISSQFPSEEYVELQRRRARFERTGRLCLLISGVIGLALLLYAAVEFKIILLGPGIPIGAAIVALIAFLLLSGFFFNYPKLFMKAKSRPPDENPPAAVVTAKLIEDRPFDPASSVIEGTTEFLKVPRARRKD